MLVSPHRQPGSCRGARSRPGRGAGRAAITSGLAARLLLGLSRLPMRCAASTGGSYAGPWRGALRSARGALAEISQCEECARELHERGRDEQGFEKQRQEIMSWRDVL